MTTDDNDDEAKMNSPTVWDLVKDGSKNDNPENKQKLQQMYSNVAELYHTYRPGYSDEIVNGAFQKCQLLKKDKDAKVKILELGCGPGTLTVQLAQRGWDVVALDPGDGMIEKARQVCKDYPNVQLLQSTYKNYTADEKFDAIIAASSMHWVLAETEKEKIIEKMSTHLQDDGSLILFWNFPPAPSDELLDKIAEALNHPKPFHFSNGGSAALKERVWEHALEPLETSVHFSPLDTVIHTIDETIPIESYLNYLQTMSNFISMDKDKRDSIIETSRKILKENSSGDVVATRRFTMVNILSKCKTTQ